MPAPTLFCISTRLALKWAELRVPFTIVRSFGYSVLIQL